MAKSKPKLDCAGAHGRAGIAIAALVVLGALMMLRAAGLDPTVSSEGVPQVSPATWLMLVLYLLPMVAYLRWLHLAYRNAERLEPSVALGFTPGQAIWGFFIPFVNCVRPYRALRSLHRTSDPSDLPARREQREVPNVSYRQRPLVDEPKWSAPRVPVGTWWAAYMGSTLLNTVLDFSRLSIGPASAHHPNIAQASVAGYVAFQISTALGIVAAGLGALVVYGIDKNQNERRRRLRAIRAEGPRTATLGDAEDTPSSEDRATARQARYAQRRARRAHRDPSSR